MDLDTLLNVALVLLFILIGGVFAGTELAIVSLRDSQIRAIEESGPRGQQIGRLVRDPNQFLAAVQVGVTLAGFFSSAYGASTLAPDVAPLLRGIGLGEGAADTVAFIGMTLFIAYLSLVLGELVPKRLAMQRSVAFTRVLAPPLGALARLMRPAIWLLSASTNVVVRLLGGDPRAVNESVSAEEVRDIIDSNENLPSESRAILRDVFRARDRRLVEIMRPRPDVHFLDASTPLADARSEALRLPHSRYPVVRGSVDDVLGFVHLRDLVGDTPHPGGTVADVTREMLALPGSVPLLTALEAMRGGSHQIVLVVDEYGGTEGIATMEDLVEEVVGEIYDEYDVDRDPEDSHLKAGDSIEVDGSLIIDEVESIAGVDVPEGPYETIAGYVIDRLGRLAEVGDATELEAHLLTVTAVDGNRITRVRITPPTRNEEESAAEREPSPAR